MTMMSWIVAALTVAQVARGMVPDIGITGSAEAVGTTRSLLGRRELLNCSGMWIQCGGKNWTGPTCCSSGTTCTKKNEYYSQCLKANGLQQSNASKKVVTQQSGGNSGNSGNNSGSGGGGGGEFSLCIQGSSETYGPTVEQREYPKQGSAVTITSGGKCSWEEYAGGFDGFPSPAIDDGHEKGMDMAIKQMFPGDRTKQTAFLVSMIDIAKPVDMDYPRDKAKADNGARMDNIYKLNNACSQLISISC